MPFYKCEKGGGVFTCDECQPSFCRKHSEGHRQELTKEMEIIDQEHDILQRYIMREIDTHPLLSRIDLWEEESINKIQQVATQVSNRFKSVDRWNKANTEVYNEQTNKRTSV